MKKNQHKRQIKIISTSTNSVDFQFDSKKLLTKISSIILTKEKKKYSAQKFEVISDNVLRASFSNLTNGEYLALVKIGKEEVELVVNVVTPQLNLKVLQNNFGDLEIISLADKFPTLESVSLANAEYQKSLLIEAFPDIIIRDKKIIIPHYLLILSMALPIGDYQLKLQFSCQVITTDFKMIKGAIVNDQEVIIKQVDAFSISCANQKWLNNIYEIAFYNRQQILVDLAISSFSVVDDALIINHQEFTDLFKDLVDAEYYLIIKSRGFVDYTSDYFLIKCGRELASYSDVDYTFINDNLAISCSDKQWLHSCFGLNIFDLDQQLVFSFDWLQQSEQVTISQQSILIKQEVFSHLSNDVYLIELLNYQKQQNYFIKKELILDIAKVDYYSVFFKKENSDLVINSDDLVWLKNIKKVTLAPTEFSEIAVDFNFNNDSIVISDTELANKIISEQVYKLLIYADGYQVYQKSDWNFNQHLKLLSGNFTLTIDSDEENNLFLLSDDADIIEGLVKIQFIKNNDINEIVIKKEVGCEFLVDGYKFSANYLYNYNIVAGSYKILLYVDGYQAYHFPSKVKVGSNLKSFSAEAGVYQDNQRHLVIECNNTDWFEQLALLELSIDHFGYHEQIRISLKDPNEGIVFTHNKLTLSFALLSEHLAALASDYYPIRLISNNGRVLHQGAVWLSSNIDVLLPAPFLLSVKIDTNGDLILTSAKTGYLHNVEKMIVINTEYRGSVTFIDLKKIKVDVSATTLSIAQSELTSCGIGYGDINVIICAFSFEDTIVRGKSFYSNRIIWDYVNITQNNDGSLVITSENSDWLNKVTSIKFEDLTKVDGYYLGELTTQDLLFKDNSIVIDRINLKKLIYSNSNISITIKAQNYLSKSLVWHFSTNVFNNEEKLQFKQLVDGSLMVNNIAFLINDLEKLVFEPIHQDYYLVEDYYIKSQEVNNGSLNIDGKELLETTGIKEGLYKVKLISAAANEIVSDNLLLIHKGSDKGFLVDISIERYPNNLEVIEGLDVDFSGLELMANYSDGSSEKISDYSYTITPRNQERLKVTLHYYHQNISFEVKVLPKSLSYLTIQALPNKLVYQLQDSFDSSGLVVLAHYDNNTVLELLDYNLTGYTNTLGTKEIYVEYLSRVVSFNVKVISRQLVELAIVSPVVKKEYLENEELDLLGLKVLAKYANDTEELIEDYLVTGYDGAPGLKNINVVYGSLKTSFEVEVRAKKLVSIKASLSNGAITLIENQEFDRKAIEVMAYFDNDTKMEVTDYLISGYDYQVGNKSLEISYLNEIDYINVEIVKRSLVKIKILHYPTKLQYVQNENLDTSGLELLAIYNNDTQEIVSDYQVYADMNYPGDIPVKVRYGSKFEVYYINIEPKAIAKLTIDHMPDKHVYIEGEEFIANGLKVKAIYNDQTSVDIFDYSIKGFDNQAGLKNMRVEYLNFSENFQVEVLEKSIISFKITRLPYKLQYEEYEEFSDLGLQLTIYYNNNTSELVSYDHISDFKNEVGNQEIFVRYLNFTTSFNISVIKKSIKSLKLEKLPSKLTYFENENLDLTGLELRAYYRNNYYEIITDYNVKGYTGQAGSNTIFLEYQDKIAIFKVEVLMKSVVSIAVTLSKDFKELIEGQALEHENLIVIAKYDNGDQNRVYNYKISGFDSSAGNKIIKVHYDNFVERLSIKVKEKELIDLEIISYPIKRIYLEGEALELKGLVVQGRYSNDQTIIIHDYQVSALTSELAEQLVNVKYLNLTVGFKILVVAKKVSGISIAKLPEKLEYLEQEEFNPLGMVVLADFNNDTSMEVLDYSITGFDYTEGIKNILVTYHGFKASFRVDVKAKEMVALKI
ncbi:MAG: bacterial Ig-like domain-containing protein, partial [Erysipelotrichaceae bacterium]